MGSFKENKKQAIEKAKEKGDTVIQNFENTRVQELQTVKGLIDSISIEDPEDQELVDSLNDSYLEAGKAAHQEEVESVVNEANSELEENKNEISDERSNVEQAAERVREMQSTTDLASGAASSVESSLESSANEYSDMESETEDIEEQLRSNSDNIRDRIESLFG